MIGLGLLVEALATSLHDHAGGFAWNLRLSDEREDVVQVALWYEREGRHVSGTWALDVDERVWRFELRQDPRRVDRLVRETVAAARRALEAPEGDHQRARKSLAALVDSRLGERWSFDLEERGAHVEVTVRVGTPGSRALAGKLTLRREEADELHRSVGPDALVTKTTGFL